MKPPRTTRQAPLRRQMLLAVALPLAGLGLLGGALTRCTPDMATQQAALAAERNRLAPVVAALEAEGCSVETRYGGLRVTLPRAQALEITPMQAKELALEIRGRSGGIVRLMSPGGQQLAEAP